LELGKRRGIGTGLTWYEKEGEPDSSEGMK